MWLRSVVFHNARFTLDTEAPWFVNNHTAPRQQSPGHSHQSGISLCRSASDSAPLLCLDYMYYLCLPLSLWVWLCVCQGALCCAASSVNRKVKMGSKGKGARKIGTLCGASSCCVWTNYMESHLFNLILVSSICDPESEPWTECQSLVERHSQM